MPLPEHLEIVVETPADAASQKLILDGLIAYNDSQTGDFPYEPLTLVVRERDGRKLGGMDAQVGYGWMFIKLFWLPEELRRHGVGTHLMQAAEAEAIRRDCVGVWLDTFSFQARGFYEKLGYEVFGEIAPYPPPGEARYFLKKHLKKVGRP